MANSKYGARGGSNSRNTATKGIAPELVTFVKVGRDDLPNNDKANALKKKFPEQKMLGVAAIKRWQDSGNMILEIDHELLSAPDQYGKSSYVIFDMEYVGE